MRIWDEVNYCWLECESVWNGRDSLTDGSGWQQKESPLLKHAPGRKDWPSQDEGRKMKSEMVYEWGHRPINIEKAPVTGPSRYQCRCGRTKRVDQPACAFCRHGGISLRGKCRKCGHSRQIGGLSRLCEACRPAGKAA